MRLLIIFWFLNSRPICIPWPVSLFFLILLFLLLLLLDLLSKLSCKISAWLFRIRLYFIWLYFRIIFYLRGSAVNIKHELSHGASIFFVIDGFWLKRFEILNACISKGNHIWICIHVALRSKSNIILLFLLHFNFSICICQCIWQLKRGSVLLFFIWNKNFLYFWFKLVFFYYLFCLFHFCGSRFFFLLHIC